MRTRRVPFFGLPEDTATLGSMGDGSADEPPPELVQLASVPTTHPDAVEKGISLPLGFMAHRGENRRTRRAAVANWVPPEGASPVLNGIYPNDNPPKMPTRRELWLQRQKHRRGKLDIELRRLQKRKVAR